MRIDRRIHAAFLIPTLLGGLAFAQTPPGAAQTDKPAASAGAKATPGAASLHDVMHKGAQQMQAMQMSGDVDHDFLMAMRDHHMQAIDMANVALAQGKDAKVKALAKKMMVAQKKDLKEIDALMAKHMSGDSGGHKTEGHKH